jgi:hypothetical protein
MCRRHLVVVVLAIIALVSLGAWTSAQVFRPEPVDPPVVVSGPDFGFRIESHVGGEIHGRLVVRIKGQWVTVTEAFDTTRRLGSH